MLRRVRLLKQILGSEKGQALPIVLALLVIGGLAIVPGLNYASATLNSSRTIEESMKGIYAADAGVEYVLWYLGEHESEPEDGALSENINQMPVNIQTVETGYFVLYLGELILNDGEHVDWLSVDSIMVWDEVAEAYKYIITVTWQAESGEPPIKLMEVGARIPVGYEYQQDSAALFEENLSTADTDDDEDDENELTMSQDGSGAWLLNWELGTPRPEITEAEQVRTQTFYITGTGDLENDYAWVAAKRGDVGEVGEIEGTAYRITATATRPGDGRTTAQIVSDIVVGGGMTYIISWQISN